MRYLVTLVAVLFALNAGAVTRTVNPGPTSTINSAISASAAGDIVLVKSGAYTGGGLNMNRNGVQVHMEPGVVLNGGNSGQAATIMCSDCAIIGLVDNGDWLRKPLFIDYAYGIGTNDITGRNRVTVRNIVQRRTNYGFWISGDNWTVEWCEVDRIIKRSSGGDADYGRMFGRNHVMRRNYFHGTNIPTDITPGHTDAVQHYNQNGEILQNILIEENIFTDVVQFYFLGNETGNSSSMANITIRNNVNWGTRFSSGGNPIYLGAPSWTLYAGKNGRVNNLVYENNTSTTSSNYLGVITGTTARISKNINATIGNKLGTVWILEGNSPSNINTTGGNMHWNYNWRGEMSPASDILNVDPQFQNSSNVVGADGLPFTADDGWRALNPAAAGFGAQIPTGTTPPPPTDTTPPTITLIGANPLTLAFGATFTDPGATVTDNVDDPRTIQGTGTVNTGVAGTYTRTYNATDAALNAATPVTREVIVQSAPNTAPTVSIAPVGPFTLAPGSTGISVTVTAAGADAQGPVAFQWTGGPATASWSWVQPAGTVTRTITVTDSGGLTATASVTVVVNPAPVGEDMATQAELDQAVLDIKVMLLAEIAKVNNAIAAESVTRSTEDTTINARITALGTPMTPADVVALITAEFNRRPKATVLQ